jgi:SAM-dependent methyltransferase
MAAWRTRWWRRRPRGPHTQELQETFSAIYDNGTWTDKLPGMPRSGRGSIYERSKSVADFIEEQIDGGHVRSIVDVGCGDLTYMARVDAVVSGRVSYVGYDIVPALVAEHRRLPWGRFRVGDVTADGFRADADLVIVKDVLFHFTDEQIARALDNLVASRWQLLLVTSTDNESNEDRTFDRWHYAPLNLTAPPYAFRPERVLDRIDGGGFLVLRPEDVTRPT